MITDALLELVRDGELQPTAKRIAEKAGVSARSVFRLFADLDQLFAAAVLAQQARTAPFFVLPLTAGTRRARIDGLVEARSRLYEEITPVRRAAALYSPFYQVIADDHARIDAILRDQLASVFEVELRGLRPAARRDLIDALEAITSWTCWDGLRGDQGLGINRSRQAVHATVGALVSTVCGADAGDVEPR